jgi:probable rRNA maturation factor
VDWVLQEHQVPVKMEVSLSLVNDQTIQELNRTYRGVDAPTDVLSFCQLESLDEEPEYEDLNEEQVLGDIVISLETASRQAEEYGHSLAREIGFLTLHGLLHLLGYDHQDPGEEAAMLAKQKEILARWEQFQRDSGS